MEYQVWSIGRFGLAIGRRGEVSAVNDETADASPTRPYLETD
jgi:hypothetical protein